MIFFDKLILIKTNRSVRIGFGRHEGIWYVRIDLWFVGYRLSQKIKL